MPLKLSAISKSNPTVEIGEPVYTIAGDSTTNATATTANADYVLAGQVYPQSSYPRLYRTLGLINASPWTLRASNTTSIIYGITYGSGVYVYTGAGGVLETSTNFVVWTNNSSNRTSSSIYTAVYGNGLYVYAGAGGMIRTSTDQKVWTTKTTLPNDPIVNYSILSSIYSNGLYIVGASSGGLWTSTDAVTWSPRTSGTSSAINGLAYGQGFYVYAGAGGLLETSTDLVTWTGYTNNRTSTAIYTALYNNGLYLYGGAGGMIRTSTDQKTWTTRRPLLNDSIANYSILSSTYTNDLYYLTGSGGQIWTSTDTVTWSNRNSGTSSNINSFAYGQGFYVYAGAGGLLETSTDAITWTGYTANRTSTAIYTALYNNGLYLYGGAGGMIRTSTDQKVWTTRRPLHNDGISSYNFNSSLYANGLYLMAGTSGALWSSTDAITWTSRASGTSSTINGLVYGQGLYVFTGAGGVISSSTDAVTWVSQTSGTTAVLYRVAYANGLFVVAGDSGALRTSTDAVTWTAKTGNTAINYRGLDYGANRWVAVGYVNNAGGDAASGQVQYYRTSTDGVTWGADTAFSGGWSRMVNCMTFDGTRFVTGHTAGISWTSTDGVSWALNSTPTSSTLNFIMTVSGETSIYGDGGTIMYIRNYDYGNIYSYNSFTTSPLYRIAYSNGLFVVAGDSGALRTSTDAVTWRIKTGSTAISYRGLEYGASKWVVVGYVNNAGGDAAGSQVQHYRTSTDGVTWGADTAFSSGWSRMVNCMTFDGTRFVTGHTTGVSWTSTDGVSWALNSTPTGNTLNFIMTVSGEISIYGDGGTIMYMRNYDYGNIYSYNSFTTAALYRIAYSNGLFVVAGDSGALRTSTDAATWRIKTGNSALNYRGVDYGTDKWVAVAHVNNAGGDAVGAQVQHYRTSTDGVTWGADTAFTGGWSRMVNSMAYGSSVFTAGGTIGTMYTSTNGTTWTTLASGLNGTGSTINGLLATGNETMYYGDSGTLGYSRNPAASWYFYSNAGTTVDLNSVTYGNGLFVVAGGGGVIRTSTDGSTWFVQLSNTSGTFNTVVYGTGLYVAGGNTGLVQSSTDGVTWTSRTGASSGNVYAMSFDGSLYLAAGASGLVWTSTNAITWTARTSGTSSDIWTIRYGNGVYIYAGTGGVMSTSTNAITWTQRANLTTSSIRSVTYGNGSYLAAGFGGFLASSTDGISWASNQNSATTSSIYDIEFGNNSYFYAGQGGAVASSTDNSTKVYSPFYNAATDFYVPNYTPALRPTLQTTAVYSTGTYVTYIRAR